MTMPKSCFLVRAVVAEPLRDKFDHWYSTDHLPWAIRIFRYFGQQRVIVISRVPPPSAGTVLISLLFWQLSAAGGWDTNTTVG